MALHASGRGDESRQTEGLVESEIKKLGPYIPSIPPLFHKEGSLLLISFVINWGFSIVKITKF